MDVKLNMADEVFRRTLTQFSTMSPSFFPIKLKEKSYPVVGCSFSHTSFLLDYYYLDPSSVSLVSKLIYVSSKDRYVYVSSSSLHVRYRINFATCTWLKIKDCAGEVVVPFTRHNFV